MINIQLAGFSLLYVCNEKWILYIFLHYSLLRIQITNMIFVSVTNVQHNKLRTYNTLSTLQHILAFVLRYYLFYIILCLNSFYRVWDENNFDGFSHLIDLVKRFTQIYWYKKKLIKIVFAVEFFSGPL